MSVFYCHPSLKMADSNKVNIYAKLSSIQKIGKKWHFLIFVIEIQKK